MLPLLLAAAAPLAELAGEEIAKLIAGDDPATTQKGAAVAQALINAAGTVAGVTITRPEDIKPLAEAITDKPGGLEDFRAAVANEMLALLTLDNQDRADARSQTVELAKTGSSIAWGAPAVSLVVLIGFFAVMVLLFVIPQAGMPERTFNLLNMLFGALVLGFGQVTSYWLGSSSGSAKKSDIISNAINLGNISGKQK